MTDTPIDDPEQTESWTALDLALRIAALVDEKQGERTVVMHVGPAIQVTDYFVVTEGLNKRHLGAIAEHVTKTLKQFGLHRMGGSSMNDQDWVLADFGAVVLHAFSSEARSFYDLENLWGDCETVLGSVAADSGTTDAAETSADEPDAPETDADETHAAEANAPEASAGDDD